MGFSLKTHGFNLKNLQEQGFPLATSCVDLPQKQKSKLAACRQANLGQMAVGQNQWHHLGVAAPPILEPILVGIGMFIGG